MRRRMGVFGKTDKTQPLQRTRTIKRMMRRRTEKKRMRKTKKKLSRLCRKYHRSNKSNPLYLPSLLGEQLDCSKTMLTVVLTC